VTLTAQARRQLAVKANILQQLQGTCVRCQRANRWLTWRRIPTSVAMVAWCADQEKCSRSIVRARQKAERAARVAAHIATCEALIRDSPTPEGNLMPASSYRKKPVVIQAIQFVSFNTNGVECEVFLGKDFSTHLPGTDQILISTLEGEMACSAGDFIIRGIKGEHYCCRGDIFEATYEAVDTAGS
jgi:hypothetical protein